MSSRRENSAVARAGGTARAEDVLGEIIRRVVDVAQPDRILLFGSTARGGARPKDHPSGESDVDLMVVKQEPCDRSRLTGEIYRRLHGVGRAVDVLVVTPEQVERYRDAHGLVFAPVLRDGKEVYRA